MRLRAETVLITAMGVFAVTGWTAVQLLDRGPEPTVDPGTEPVGVVGAPPPPAPPPALPGQLTAAEWFQHVRARCNPVEIGVTLKRSPAPATAQGPMYQAACHALAGEIGEARALVRGLPEAARPRAAGIIFDAGHPVADAGDEIAAGPLMELVVEFWPSHYMALYHAGVAAWEMGDGKRASGYLTRFLELYQVDDGWRSRALSILERIRSGR